MTYRLVFLLALLTAAHVLHSQPSQNIARNHSGDAGTPYQTHFSPKIYHADPQNWAILQRPDGVMVIGNGDGIMTFDGAAWQTTPVLNNNLVRCLAQGPQDRIYLGGYNEIGFIDYSLNDPRYVSLVMSLPPTHREFGHTWNVTISNNDVYFSTDKWMFRWSNETFEVIDLGIENCRAFATPYNGKILVQPFTGKLAEMAGKTTKPLDGGEFYLEKRITSIFPYDSARALISTTQNGLFLYDGHTSTPFATHLLDYFATNRLYKAIKLRNGNMAFATLQKGVVILDPKGDVVQFLDKDGGLGDDVVYNLFEDREGALWTAMSVGLSRVELQSPMSLFSKQNGLPGAVNDIVRFEGKIFAATMLGLFELDPAATATTHATFRQRDEIHSSVWALKVANGSMLLATDDGTMEMKSGRLRYLDRESGAVILAPEQDPEMALVGLADGVNVLRYGSGAWRSHGRIPDLTVDVGEMCEGVDGEIWLGTFSEGAVRLSFKDKRSGEQLRPAVTRFGAAHGLPVGYVQIHQVNGEVAFRSEPRNQLYLFNSSFNRFENFPPDRLPPGYDSTNHYPVAGEKSGVLWMVDRCPTRSSYDLLRLRKAEHGYEKRILPFARVREDFDEVIFEERDGIMWMGGLDGILRYDLNMISPGARTVNVIFNGITVTHDSVVHRGVGNVSNHQSFPYALNSIAFSYAGTSFDLLNENQFQYILSGFDDDWSSWSNHTSKSYTQIPEGDYVFKVRARDIHGNVSVETRYAFTIRPPWYRHLLSYLGYAIALGGLVAGAGKIRSRKLERDNAELSRIIYERTTEVSLKNLQLEQQAEELIAQTEKLKEVDKLKSAFFMNISHEFRTPLSLILAPLEQEISEGQATRQTEIMYRNGRRLQRLINHLLDLSKIEAGEMRIFLSYDDLTAHIRSIARSFEPLAESRDITLVYDIPLTPFLTYFDIEKTETVLYNLLSNALKFTRPQGRVTLSMTISDDMKSCELNVTDNGPGIEASCIEKIFDRFYQVESGSQRTFEGSGIGLALTKELVELMQGTITVRSEPGDGTAFRVTLPLTRGESTIMPEDIATATIHEADLLSISGHSQMADRSGSRRDATILLVEDNEDLALYLTGILEKRYYVRTARNGEEALDIARMSAPDLILSDMMMPKMDGFALCEEIRKEPLTSHLPFILLTARTNIESRLAGLELGADDYLTKPFVIAELLVRINNLLEQRRKLRDRFRQELTIAPQHVTVTSADEAFIRRVIEVTETHLKDSSFSVDRLSEELGISRKHLHRKLVALADQTPNEFIRVFRLKRAMQLLQQQSGSVKEVAYAVGFNNLSYFAKCFKEEFNMSPNEVTVARYTAA